MSQQLDGFSVRLGDKLPDVRNQDLGIRRYLAKNLMEVGMRVPPHLQQVGYQDYRSPPSRVTSTLTRAVVQGFRNGSMASQTECSS